MVNVIHSTYGLYGISKKPNNCPCMAAKTLYILYIYIYITIDTIHAIYNRQVPLALQLPQPPPYTPPTTTTVYSRDWNQVCQHGKYGSFSQLRVMLCEFKNHLPYSAIYENSAL